MKWMRCAMQCAAGSLVLSLLGCSAEPDAGDVASTEQDIIGGSAARLGARPWQVEISRSGGQWCGGSVLTREWVLTAAHCLDGVPTTELRLRVGLIDREAPGAAAQTRGVRRAVVHPSFSLVDLDHDVALLQLDAPLTFNANVQPIGIRSSDAPVGTNAIVSGWGRPVAAVRAPSRALLEVTLPVVSEAACTAAGLGFLLDSMVCAGFAPGAQGACFGDSGGPLAAPRAAGSGWELIGVVSWGSRGCNSYTVFSRLSRSRAWILGVVGTLPVIGDATGDGCVDTADYNLINANFGLAVPPGNRAADLNGDGVVNIQDRLIVVQNWGAGCTP